jgi:ferric-dicitrate binding protein FerR (iron transport regulator)
MKPPHDTPDADRALREAIHWELRNWRSDPGSPDSPSEWLRRSPEHASSALEVLIAKELLKQLPAEQWAELAPAAQQPASTVFRYVWRAAAIAAAVGIVGFGARRFHLMDQIASAAQQETYTARIGEHRRVPLQDGSHLDLNTDTGVTLRLTSTVREVQLDRGEALFDVADDKSRPFIVRAGSIRIEAIGTRFSVRLSEDGRVETLVTEGRVRIEAGKQSSEVAARQIATVDDGRVRVQAVTQFRIGDRLAWMQGMVKFEDVSLKEAVEEINRYNDIKIVVDERLSGKQIGGAFVATQPRRFAEALRGLKLASSSEMRGMDGVETIRLVPMGEGGSESRRAP